VPGPAHCCFPHQLRLPQDVFFRELDALPYLLPILFSVFSLDGATGIHVVHQGYHYFGGLQVDDRFLDVLIEIFSVALLHVHEVFDHDLPLLLKHSHQLRHVLAS